MRENFLKEIFNGNVIPIHEYFKMVEEIIDAIIDNQDTYGNFELIKCDNWESAALWIILFKIINNSNSLLCRQTNLHINIDNHQNFIVSNNHSLKTNFLVLRWVVITEPQNVQLINDKNINLAGHKIKDIKGSFTCSYADMRSTLRDITSSSNLNYSTQQNFIKLLTESICIDGPINYSKNRDNILYQPKTYTIYY